MSTPSLLLSQTVPAPGDLIGASRDRMGQWYAHRVTRAGETGISLEYTPVMVVTARAIQDYWNGNRHGFTMPELCAAVAVGNGREE